MKQKLKLSKDLQVAQQIAVSLGVPRSYGGLDGLIESVGVGESPMGEMTGLGDRATPPQCR